MNPATIPVLLDTDLGTNIDDALCLSYLLGQSRCRLLGVTTVGSRSVRRADLARALCASWGRERVPVLAGLEPPHSLPDRKDDPWQADSVEAPRSARPADAQEAVTFLAKTIREHAGEVTLITVGPLTNVARLLDDHPDACTNLRGVVSMCGVFGDPPPGYGPVETTVGLDPQAAARVLEEPLPRHRVLGLETTGAFELPAAEVRQRLADSVPTLLRRLLAAWEERHPGLRFHDPLATAALFVPELFTFRPACCTVELAPPSRRGRTAARLHGANLPHQLLHAVDYRRFARHLFDTIA